MDFLANPIKLTGRQKGKQTKLNIENTSNGLFTSLFCWLNLYGWVKNHSHLNIKMEKLFYLIPCCFNITYKVLKNLLFVSLSSSFHWFCCEGTILINQPPHSCSKRVKYAPVTCMLKHWFHVLFMTGTLWELRKLRAFHKLT